MAITVVCDGGCGAQTDKLDNFEQFGAIKKVWYCSNCAEKMKKLYTTRDSLHSDHAALLTDALLFEIGKFKKELPNATLPDAPE